MKVQVLMSSYNGEKFLEEQIKSILTQKGIEVSLLVRDDGSTDSTKEILEKLKKKDSRIKCLYENNIGVKKSFLRLIKNASPDADYYALSDQDDIWLEDKLITAVKGLKVEDANIPLIYGSAVFLYKNEEIISKQFVCPQLKLGNFLIKNYYPGCTMVFNKKMKELIDRVDYNKLEAKPLHDHWMNLICTACGGKVLIDQTPHILYRQHGDNTIGDRNLIQKLKGNGLLTHSDHTRFNICKELHGLYGECEDECSIAVIRTVLNYRESFEQRMKLAFDKEIKPISIIEKISIFLITVMGKF